VSAVLGIPREHEAQFTRFCSACVDGIDPRLSPEERARALEPFAPGIELLNALIEERRRRPADDLLSTLQAADQEGDRLSQEELVALVMALLSTGADTTVHLISYAIYQLLRHPDQLALLRAQPELMRDALDEVLRFDFFSKLSVPRYARESIEMSGVK